MRVLDVRGARLLVVAGAIAGSALVGSVAEAADGSPSGEPTVITTPDLTSVEIDGSPIEVTGVDPPSDGVPFGDVAVIEVVVPTPPATGPDTVDPVLTEPIGAPVVGEAFTEPSASDGSSVSTASDPAVAVALDDATVVELESHDEGDAEHGSGGSGGQGNPYRMTFTVVWEDSEGMQITTLDVVLSPELLAQFELSAASQTGKGRATSATCTYPDGGTVLRCEFHNPGHGAGSDGMIIPARPTATYTVTVNPMAGWTIDGADDVAYSARSLCPRGGGGHEDGGHEEGGDEAGGHEEGGQEGGHESGGTQGGHEGGGGQGGDVSCVHTVVMRQIAAPPQPPPPPPPPAEPPSLPAPESGAVPAPPVTAEPDPVVQSFASAPSALPATGSSISVILVAAGVIVALGSALAGLTRRAS